MYPTVLLPFSFMSTYGKSVLPIAQAMYLGTVLDSSLPVMPPILYLSVSPFTYIQNYSLSPHLHCDCPYAHNHYLSAESLDCLPPVGSDIIFELEREAPGPQATTLDKVLVGTGDCG